MKYKSVIGFLLCCVFLLTAISCSTKPDVPVESTAELSNTAAEIETVEPINWNISTERYSIQEIDGQCYITFKDEYIASEEDRNACQLGEIYFDSMEDMVQAFLNNGLTPDQEIVIQSAFSKTDNGISLWSTNQLYDAKLPEDVAVSSVALHGETYDFFLSCELFDYGSVAYVDDWTVSKDRMYDWSKGATVTRDEESTFDGVPCRIVEYYNSSETYRDIFIETEQDGKKVDMVLRYLLEDKRTNPERVSDTAPWTVKMYCEDDGVYYKASIDELTETPTYEWLSSFGLTPYVPADSE